jgi:aminopeptidase N
VPLKDGKSVVIERILGAGTNYETDHAETESVTLEFTSDSSEARFGGSFFFALSSHNWLRFMKSLFLLFLTVACSSLNKSKSAWSVKQHIQVKEDHLEIMTEASVPDEEIEFCPEELVVGQAGPLPGKWQTQHKAFFKETDQGIIRYQNDHDTILYTFLQPSAACQLFPIPKSKIARMHFDLTLQLPKHWVVVGFAKATLVSEDKNTKTWRMKSSEAIPFMNFSFFVGDIKSFGDDPSYYSLGNASPDSVKKIMEEYLSIQKMVADYFTFTPGKTYDLISIPQFEPGAMENFGTITVTDDLFNETAKPKDWSNIRRFVLLHESIHQIIGNCLSPSRKGQVFLVEGLTQHFANEISKGLADYKNPFQGPIPDGFEMDTSDENINLFFSKSSYNLGSLIFKKISHQKGDFYLRDKVKQWHKENGCTEFDYSSFDPVLKNKVLGSHF